MTRRVKTTVEDPQTAVEGLAEEPTGTAAPAPGPAGGDQALAAAAVASARRASRRLNVVLSVNLFILLMVLAAGAYAVMVAGAPKGAPAIAAKPVSTAGGMTWVRSIYSWGEESDQSLVAPNTVAIAQDGTIWTNSRNKYAVAFHRDSTFDRVLMTDPRGAGTKPKEKSKPSAEATAPANVSTVFSLAINKGNALFIGDDGSGNILKFNTGGKIIDGWQAPGFTKMDANEERVAVIAPGALGVFDQKTGSPVYSIGTRGQGVDQFDLPLGVHIDDANNVYVCDTQNQRVRKFDPAGKLVWDAGTVPDRKTAREHGVVATATGTFELPTGVTVDGNGRVVVVDAFKFQVIVLDGATGKKIADYGDFGTEDGAFNNPSAIAYDRVRDYFVVADTTNNRLQIVRLPGSAKPAAAVAAAVQRNMVDRPGWVFAIPFAFMAIAIPGSSLLRRMRHRSAPAPA
jgi:hypothetical protein